MYSLVLLAIAAALAAAQDTGTIEGRVANVKTGEAVRKAVVSLTPRSSGRPVSTLTDAAGGFIFPMLAPGIYLLSAEKDGFVPMSPRQKHVAGPIALNAGQNVSGIELSLLPQGVIIGRVLDEDGDSIPNSFVSVMRYAAPGSRRAARQQGGAKSNDIGEFRIANLAPGKYLLRALANGNRALSGSAEDYAPTFHPSTINPEAAVAVEVTAGIETTGVQIQMRKVFLFRVKGVVSGLRPNSPVQPAQVRLMPAVAFAMITGWGTSIADLKADGSFEFQRVPQGAYTLEVLKTNRHPVTLGRVSLTVSSGNVDDLIVPLREPVSISGKVRVEDGGPAIEKGLRLFLTPFAGLPMNPYAAEPDQDGAFEIPMVSPDVYRLVLGAGSARFYVKSVRGADQDFTHSGIDLNSAGTLTDLEIVLGANPGTIECVVKEDEKPSYGRFVSTVRLDSEGFALYDQQSGYSGPEGILQWRGLAPGDYLVFAWNEPVADAILDPDFLRLHQKDAVKVTVREGSAERVEPKLIIVN